MNLQLCLIKHYGIHFIFLSIRMKNFSVHSIIKNHRFVSVSVWSVLFITSFQFLCNKLLSMQTLKRRGLYIVEVIFPDYPHLFAVQTCTCSCSVSAENFFSLYSSVKNCGFFSLRDCAENFSLNRLAQSWRNFLNRLSLKL